MSGDPPSNNRSHIRGPLSGPDHDPHIQRIIDHANNLFPDTEHHLPQIVLSSTSQWDTQDLTRNLGSVADQLNEYDDLDDFDRSVLGHPPAVNHPLNIEDTSSSNGVSQRLSLPRGASANGPTRVLGDASHHFRPFVPRDPDRLSQFQNPQYSDNHQRFDGTSSSTLGTPRDNESSRALLLQPSTQDTLNPLETLVRSPPTQSVPSRNNAQRGGELLRGSQLFVPFSDRAVGTTPSIDSLTSSSPSNVGFSSPSIRISQEKQRQVAKSNQNMPKWNQNLELELDHASGLPPIVNNTRLVDPRQSLPDKFRAIFPFQLFNAVQSRCFPLVYGTNDNVVISAPTGSGKTAILEMAICKLVSGQEGDNYKIVYQAPTKSLCSEKAREWQKKFSHMNLPCVELTGDTSQTEAHRIGSASIIVTTPEKWDSITRKWKDHRKLLDLVRLVLIDEVHILKDTRGATLEAVVSRMKTIGASIRFVAISATVPNIDDVAKWLGRDHQNQLEPARYEVFGEELRPVKLQRYVYGYDGAHNDFIFEKALDGKLNFLLAKHSEKKPIMVFCFTRKSCERTAQSLAEWWSTCRADDRAWPPPTDLIPVLSQDLQELVRHGVAFHHAGLDAQDRAAIEASFLSGQLHVICCTSTLAVGVNLPCHTVVLKGTSHYTDGGPQEYSDLEVMQMLGRAGRPQFDSSAVAIIMTKSANTKRYEKLVSGEERLESTLHQNLLEHINSEIGLGTIQDIPTAKKWISGTFLSVRVRQSPQSYNLEGIQSASGADEQMEEWCERNVKLLQDHGLVTKSTPLACTEYGQAMSKYMIQFETMKLLLSIPRGAGVEEMLKFICKATEFKDFKFKPAERTVFRELNKSPLVLHPIKETLTLTWHKIFMTVQIHLGGVDLPTDKESGFIRQSIQREKRVIFDHLRRLVRCVTDCKIFESDGLGTRVATELARSIVAQAWENKPAQLSQIPGFGPVAVRKWTSHGVQTVLSVADKGVQDIERIASRNPPYGRNLQKILENFPRLTLTVDIIDSRIPNLESDEQVSVALRVHLGHRNAKPVPYWKDKVPTLTFIVLTSDGNLSYVWRGNMKKLDAPNGLDLRFPVALTSPNQTIFCHFNCEEIVGTQVMKALEPNVPASAFRTINHSDVQSAIAEQDSLGIEDDYEDISDDAMLGALGIPEPVNRRSEQNYVGSDYSDDDFPLIDELLDDDIPSKPQPERMENGKYFCNHPCRNGGLTKLGKNCNHKCCRDGIDRYRPRKHSKKPAGASDVHENKKASNLHSESVGIPDDRERETVKKGNSARPKSATTRASSDQEGVKHPTKVLKRTHSNATEHLNIAASKRNKRGGHDSPSNFLVDADYVDLHNVGDDGGSASPMVQRKPGGANATNRHKLLLLHEEVKGHGILSPRLTKTIDKKSGLIGESGKTDALKGEGSALADAESKPTSTLDKDLLDDLDDMSDLPDLDELIYGKKGSEQSGPIEKTTSPQVTLGVNETLYPGVVHTLRESMDYGWESNLSFTTVDELQKAADRLDLLFNDDTIEDPEPAELAEGPHAQDFPSPSRVGVIDSAFPQVDDVPWNSHASEGPKDLVGTDAPTVELQQFESEFENAFLGELIQPGEPAWVAEFDAELIESLRGVVNFVD